MPAQIQEYFPDFIELVEKYPWEVSVSYVFSRIELAKHMTIYCGIVKLHWCEAQLTRKAIDEEHMSRGRFKELFHTVFGERIPHDLLMKLEGGEKIRDKIAHGKNWEAKDVRESLVNVLTFAADFNEFVYKHGAFRPFGNLKGFKGRAESIHKSTTSWVLRGMGIPRKNNN